MSQVLRFVSTGFLLLIFPLIVFAGSDKNKTILFFSSGQVISPSLMESCYQLLKDVSADMEVQVQYESNPGVFNELSELRKYRSIVILHQLAPGLLDKYQKENFAAYMVGDEHHSGGSLISIQINNPSGTARTDQPKAWSWFSELTEMPSYKGIDPLEQMTASGLDLIALVPGMEHAANLGSVSNSKILPHPTPSGELKGGKVFTIRTENSPGLFSNGSKDHQGSSFFQSSLRQALLWIIKGDFRPGRVKLLDLSTEDRISGLKILWRTGMEDDLNDPAIFEVQKSADGAKWETISVFHGGENTKMRKIMEFWDSNPEKGRFFYRIKQSAAGKVIDISDWVRVDIGTLAPGLAIYPNPVSRELFFELDGEENENFKVTLETINGQKIMQKHSPGFYCKSEFDVSGLTPGIYLVRVVSDRVELSRKIIKY